MKSSARTRIAALTAALILTLAGTGSALFGSAAVTPPEGAPTARDLEIHTYRRIPFQGQLAGSDPDGEDLTFAVADQPRRGVVTLEGANFTYTPNANAAGSDRFTYTVTDSAGNTSLPATVTVTIDKVRSGVAYSDTQDSPAAAAAQELAEAGIFTGSRIGDQYFFEPDRPVSRSEFLAMVMETTGREVSAVTMTGFCDDAQIPAWAKAYVSAGAEQGIVCGSFTSEGVAFRGGDDLTFNEAAAILDRALDLGNVDLDAWYGDRAIVPSWAEQAVGNLEARQVMAVGSFGSSGLNEVVTRADAAQMLCAVRALEQADTETGLWGLLR